MSEQDYRIKLETFEGPMELLMHLIEKNRIDLYNLPVAELTEQYLAYLESMRSLNMEIASDFLVMAAKLLLIKSRLILPQPSAAEEDEAEEDPREELVRRIIEYKRFKQAGAYLAGLAEGQQGIFTRAPLRQAISHRPPAHVAPELLLAAMQTLLAVVPEPELPAAIVEMEHFSLKVQIELIMAALAAQKGGMWFEDLLQTHSREELAVDFMAILELVHCRAIVLNQQAAFGAIRLALRQQEAAEETEPAE